jgi:GcrA cell cycle regulator
MTPWTEERIETLKRLWADGYSASCCARELGGTTRNACIGKLWRLGLRRGGQPEKAIERRPRRPRQPVQFRPKQQLSNQPQRKATVMDMPVPKRVVSTAEPVPKMLTLLELERHHCRYPIGEPGTAKFGFCGAFAEFGESYCGFHRDLCLPIEPSKAARAAARLNGALQSALRRVA